MDNKKLFGDLNYMLYICMKFITIMKEYKIYSLNHPITKEIRYVGITTSTLNCRLSQHKYQALKKDGNTHVCKWIRALNKENLLPTINLIEFCNKKNWEEREQFWIKQFSNLTNINRGGGGVVIKRDKSGKQRSIEAHKKPVILLDKEFNLIQKFDSGIECAKFLNIANAAISNFLKGRSKSVLGYIVLYEKDYISNEYTKIFKGKAKNLYQYTLNKKFIKRHNTITEAFNEVKPGKYLSGLYSALKHGGVCGNYFWSLNKLSDHE